MNNPPNASFVSEQIEDRGFDILEPNGHSERRQWHLNAFTALRIAAEVIADMLERGESIGDEEWPT